MTQINYDLLRGGSGGEPPDGLHTANLVVAKLLELPSGDRLVTEWQSSNGREPYYWTTWHGFEGNRINITQEFLDGLGVERSAITDDAAFEQALERVQGVTYEVRTSAWSGGINTFVEDVRVPAGVQDELGTDASDLPASAPPQSGGQPAPPVTADDDIPF
jgi:hypothetical protein